MSAILHRAPVSGCIFSGNKLEQLRMTQFIQGLWHHPLAEPSWGAGHVEVARPTDPAGQAGGSLGKSSNGAIKTKPPGAASLGEVSVFGLGPRTKPARYLPSRDGNRAAI